MSEQVVSFSTSNFTKIAHIHYSMYAGGFNLIIQINQMSDNYVFNLRIQKPYFYDPNDSDR